MNAAECIIPATRISENNCADILVDRKILKEHISTFPGSCASTDSAKDGPGQRTKQL